ncbi:hypothetical protein DPMN_085699 [Dreissena polymorpha]|uniref:Uncharacterized protein n=1 Tax=Dreissena polymorpha TaxID=45954 RepID=A0A9D3YD57_DREPO|nr:hypothetical protein DPMN_085699 [Dreissena polymorpha]
MRRIKQQNTKQDRSGPGITTTAHSIGSLKGECEKLATGSHLSIRLAKRVTTIGTLNVRTLNACGKVQELTHTYGNKG